MATLVAGTNMKNMCRHFAVGCIGILALTGSVCAKAHKTIWDYSAIIEVVINRPAKDIWPYLFGVKEEIWTKQHYRRIAGEPGEVGEIYVQTFPGGQLLYETINVKPEKQLVLKMTYKEHEKDERTLYGYDFLTLSEVEGHTTLVLAQAFALPIDTPKKDLNLETKKQDKMLDEIFEGLKRLVESSP